MKVLIVGGVAGGAGTAARLRRNDESAEIIMFEKDEFISFANCGLPYYIGNIIQDKAVLQVNTPEGFHARYNTDVRVFSEVVAVNTEQKTVTVRNVKNQSEYQETYDKLVLSPGATPVIPPIEGACEAHVFTIRNIPDTYAIKDYIEQKHPKTCVVIGGGFIGVEMADNLLKAGLAVTVVEASSHVFTNIDEDMSHDVHNHMRAQGIQLQLNQTVTAITKDKVILKSGKELAADMVLLSIGVRPATNFLVGSNIALGSKGEILVNEYFETTAPDVYALGDAISVPHFVTNKQVILPLAGPANKQARIVADNLCGKKVPYGKAQGTAIALIGEMTVAAFGLTEKQLKEEKLPYYKTLTLTANHAGYYPGSQRSMFMKLLFSPAGKIYGAQITGPDGSDKRIDVLATAQRGGMTVQNLTELDLAYAPPFSNAKDPVNMAAYVACNTLEGNMNPFYLEDIPNLPKDAFLLDCRTAAEYAQGTIPGFINIELHNLRNELEKCPKGTPVYITCQVGMRGYLAEQILKDAGFEAHNFAGGYRLFAAYQQDKRAQIQENS